MRIATLRAGDLWPARSPEGIACPDTTLDATTGRAWQCAFWLVGPTA